MRQNNSNPVYAMELPEPARHHLFYHDDTEFLRYNDAFQNRIELRKIRACFGIVALVTFLVLFGWSVRRYDRFAMNCKIRNLPAEEICIKTNPELFVGEDYLLVTEEIKAMGFTDIECIPKHDLITGWIIQPGTVSRISIGGNPEFMKNDIAGKDEKVIIVYHAR